MSVKLREKKLSDGRKSLYLDIYHQGRRAYEFLEIYLTTDRQANKDAKALADSIRAKRELEMQSADHGFAAPFKRKTDFLAYFKQHFADLQKTEGLRSIEGANSTHKHLEAYTKGLSVQIGAIDEGLGLKASKSTLSPE